VILEDRRLQVESVTLRNLVDPSVRLGVALGAAFLTGAFTVGHHECVRANRHCGVNDRMAGVVVRVFVSSLTIEVIAGDRYEAGEVMSADSD
jgi:hypothetical protein